MKKIIILLSMALMSCTSPPLPFNLPDNPIKLIAVDSSKVWKLAKRTNNGNRMNMGDCFLSYRKTYTTNMKVSDNNGEHIDCGDSLHATWELIKNEDGHNFIKMTSPQIPELMNIKEDHKNFKILLLEKNKMTIAFYHRQFSDKMTTIVDYLVPEDVVVKDRDFHW